jgi:hypothetical protein
MSGSPDPSTTSTIAVRPITGALRAGVIALLVGTAAQGEELNKALNETLLTVPKEGILFTAKLETTIFKPAGRDTDPYKRALDSCNKDGQGACKLYAVDDAVVWAN